MICREDYYKFTWQLMPHTIFNYGRPLIYRIMRDEKLFVENLKKAWSEIELEKPELRSISPEFALDIIQFNTEHTGIILVIPEASKDLEALYIGITYDKDYNFRYFTYEIGRGDEDKTVYFLCECTVNEERYNYGFHAERDKSVFIKEIADLLVYDLL